MGRDGPSGTAQSKLAETFRLRGNNDHRRSHTPQILTNLGVVCKYDRLGQQLLAQDGFCTLAKCRRSSEEGKETGLLVNSWLVVLDRVLILRRCYLLTR